MSEKMPCRISDGPQYDDAVPGIDSLDDYDDSDDIERAYERGELGRDRNDEDDDSFELRRTIRDIAGTDMPYLMRRQAG